MIYKMYLNAHLTWQKMGYGLKELQDRMPQYEDKPEGKLPLLLCNDVRTPSQEDLAQLKFIYLDTPALDSFGTDFLEQLPQLRQLHIHAPERVLDLEFLTRLPQLRFLQIKCDDVVHQEALLQQQQLKYLFLEFPKPDVLSLASLPKLESVYFEPVSERLILEFLKLKPLCFVEYVPEEEYSPCFIATRIGEQYLRFFDYVHNGELYIYIESLLTLLSREDVEMTKKEQRHFVECCGILYEEVLAQYAPERKFLLRKKEYTLPDLICTFTLQQLLTGHGAELEEAMTDFRRLHKSGFDRYKMEWWLLKYGDLHNQLLIDLRKAEPADRNLEQGAEAAFLEAFRKLESCTSLLRRTASWATFLQQLRPLAPSARAQWFSLHQESLQRELLIPLKQLKFRIYTKELQLKLVGYHESLYLDKADYASALEVAEMVRAMEVAEEG